MDIAVQSVMHLHTQAGDAPVDPGPANDPTAARPAAAEAPPSARPSNQPTRTIYDTAGRKWTVRELESVEAVTHELRRSLIADGGTLVRRFRSFPADWTQMSGEALTWFIHSARPG